MIPKPKRTPPDALLEKLSRRLLGTSKPGDPKREATELAHTVLTAASRGDAAYSLIRLLNLIERAGPEKRFAVRAAAQIQAALYLDNADELFTRLLPWVKSEQRKLKRKTARQTARKTARQSRKA